MFRKRTYLRTLPARLLLYIALPLLFAVALAGTLVMGALERQFERRMQEDVQMVARALQKPVSHALERQRTGSLRSAFESALDIGRVYGAYLYSEDGTLLASLGTVMQVHQPEGAARLRQRPRGGGHYGRIQGEPVYSYYVPVRLGANRGTGLLQITRRKADIDTFMAQLRKGGIAIVVALALVMTVTVILGYHVAAGAAFQRLHESMARIRAGDRTHRAEVRGPHEVRSVVEGLNSMLDSIQNAEKQLDHVGEERLDLQNRLSASEKLASIGRLAAGIAHELGTPLGTVAGRAQRLMRRDDLPAPMVRELESVTTEVRRMERLVREVLDFGRREGLRRRRVEASDVLGAVRTALIAQGQVLEDARLEIREADTPLFLNVDPARIEQALVNLVRNAIHASPAGLVRVSWHSNAMSVRFVVEDDGPGVPAELHRRIFEPFFTTGSEERTGLGLAIVAAVAYEHGGEVTVGTSALGGARFELSLPLISAGPETSGAVGPQEIGAHAT